MKRDPGSATARICTAWTGPPIVAYCDYFQRITAGLVPACGAVYRERLKSLALFGSVARGTMRPDSDIDLLLVATGLRAGRRARLEEFEKVEESLEPLPAEARRAGVHTDLSAVFKTPEELHQGSLLFLDMTDQAVILHDPEGLLRSYLEPFRCAFRRWALTACTGEAATTGC